MRAAAPAIVLCVALACGRAPPQPAPAPAPATPLPSAAPVVDGRYAAYGLPATDAAWSVADYMRVRDALVKIEREQPELLPQAEGAGAALMQRLGSLESMVAASEGAASVEALLDLGDAVSEVFKLYAGRIARDGAFGREYVSTAAVSLAMTPILCAAMVARKKLDVAALKADPIRLEGLQKLRYGLSLVFLEVLASPLQLPGRVDAAHCAGTLARVAADVTQYLLPEERAQARALTDKLALAGAKPADVEILRASFAEEQTRVSVVAGLLEEHRTFTQQRQAILSTVMAGMLTPVEVGPEPGGVRYAFPEAGFSAVFQQPPNAQSTASEATDGVAVTIRTLGTKAATGVSQVVVCLARPSAQAGKPEGALADEAIVAMKLRNVRDIEVDGVRGKEGDGESGVNHGLVRVLAVGHGMCMIIVEYPARLAGDVASEARRFVDSFALGPYRG